MLAGEAAIGIWNGIAPEGRAAFYAWHMQEHIPERVGIPGFRRGRRYVAADGAAHPEFFTLYEADTFQVLQGADYAARLNAPTPWTRTATAHFQDTARALARVVTSVGPGSGGMVLTVRFAAGPDSGTALAALVAGCLSLPRICGAHLCEADRASSEVRTAESKDRMDITAAPGWFAMVEATDAEALHHALPDGAMEAAGAQGLRRGIYRLEYTRAKTGFAA